MRTSLLVVTAAVILGGASASWAGQKADPTPDWRCTVQLHDRDGDSIASDGNDAYVDGVDGVTCKVINEPGNVVQDRWLFMSITGTQRNPPRRVVQFTGQTNDAGASYPSFLNHGTFEVLGLARVQSSGVMPFRAYLRHPNLPFKDGYGTVAGDSNVAGSVFGGVPTSSVLVERIAPCSWLVTSYYSSAERFSNEVEGTDINPRVMRISEGAFKKGSVRGDFPMPFQATVTITSNTSPCPQ